MSQILTREIVDLEASLEAEIPCAGNSWEGPCPHNASAVWRRIGPHRCSGSHALKCDSCYGRWRSYVEPTLWEFGYIGCRECEGKFLSLDDFARYRRL